MGHRAVESATFFDFQGKCCALPSTQAFKKLKPADFCQKSAKCCRIYVLLCNLIHFSQSKNRFYLENDEERATLIDFLAKISRTGDWHQDLHAVRSLEIRQKWRTAQVACRMVHKEWQKMARAANDRERPRKKWSEGFVRRPCHSAAS